jgi:hypothetical protein
LVGNSKFSCDRIHMILSVLVPRSCSGISDEI